MKRIMIVAAVVAGCATTDEPQIYLDVEMAPGDLDNVHSNTAWVTGHIGYDENGQTKVPGVFSLRVRHWAPTGGLVPIDAADVVVHPISVCQAKANLECDLDAGACFGEAVQTTLGICILQISAFVDGQDAKACWFMGTYPRWAEATPEERDLIRELDCGGSSSLISANPPQ